jgi:hypothetical protein
MKITLYVHRFPVKDAPVAYSLVPFPSYQRHTYTRDNTVYCAVGGELRVIVPDGAVIDAERRLLCWPGEKGAVKSKANEVYALAQAHASGFEMES